MIAEVSSCRSNCREEQQSMEPLGRVISSMNHSGFDRFGIAACLVAAVVTSSTVTAATQLAIRMPRAV